MSTADISLLLCVSDPLHDVCDIVRDADTGERQRGYLLLATSSGKKKITDAPIEFKSDFQEEIKNKTKIDFPYFSSAASKSNIQLRIRTFFLKTTSQSIF